MTYLTPYLSFPFTSHSSTSQEFPSNSLPHLHSHLLITDSLNSSADFAVEHLILSARKRGGRVVLVDLEAKGYKHWQSISRKLGSTLPTETSSSSFEYIRPSSLPTASSSKTPYHSPSLFTPAEDEPTLQPLYTLLTSLLYKKEDQSSEETLLIMDGIGNLAEMGFESDEVARFIRGLMGLVRKTPSILVTRLHADHLDRPSSSNSTPSQTIFERLIRIGNGWWWRVGMLASGRSGVVMGEISAHPLLPLPIVSYEGKKETATYIPRSNPLQYRLTDTGVEVFAKGTGKGFL